MAEINSFALASQGYAQAKKLEGARGASGAASGPLTSFSNTLRANEASVAENLVGGADPQALVQALVQTELAVETAVTLRNKVVEAYQEILRMPV